ncbi:MAG: hypothetical protein OIN84_20690 [Candidatus Methanoperedens sp.]|uniref:hypothetical protein n=1 Tax=Candidatus Methanoperedens sp. BLZ2 TaxID=2035255 RepID=UPI000BE32ED2|nr:hypothetical protein [Candidatus Methanoperedens sp. BLZ2]KAB2942393.1 MAG: hypothetical protein F9K14_17235 [Candidatus Methanoperedens sp.]MBZ0176667.1 hypothetical protein [Candidatus Methanoperedens nitroreducens]MCX9080391.1 hypothetical protein [Candidatus Methanoperedens sp.]
MNENNQDSGAGTLEQKKKSSFEKKLKKGQIKIFLDANLKPELTGTFKHHIHKNSLVPWRILCLWKKRGFKPLKRGVAHVRFEDSDKKYIFPAYFSNRPEKKTDSGRAVNLQEV